MFMVNYVGKYTVHPMDPSWEHCVLRCLAGSDRFTIVIVSWVKSPTYGTFLPTYLQKGVKANLPCDFEDSGVL